MNIKPDQIEAMITALRNASYPIGEAGSLAMQAMNTLSSLRNIIFPEGILIMSQNEKALARQPQYFIQAIKDLRNRTACSLLEAKNTAEYFRDNPFA